MLMLRRFAAIGIGLAALIFAVAACGGSPDISQRGSGLPPSSASTASSNTGKITVDMVGFAWGNGQSPTDSTTIWNGYALLSNHSQQAAIDVAVQFSGYGATGKVSATGSTYVSYIAPNGRAAAVTGLSNALQPITRIDVQASPTRWHDDSYAIKLSSANIQVGGADQYDPSQYTITGEVHSAGAKNLDNVSANALCFDGAGVIIGGGFAYVQLLPAGGAAGVSVTAYSSAQPASCAIYPAPNLTALS